MATRKVNKAVAKKEEAALPAAYDYGQYAGAGFEDTSREDYALPFLYVLQANSKILTERDDLKAGMLFNTVTEEGFEANVDKGQPGIPFIPCHREHVFGEWIPRDEGGGLVGIHSPDSDIVIAAKENHKFGEWKTPDGKHELVDTFQIYGLYGRDLEAGDVDSIAFPFTSTKIKIYRQWMSRANTIKITLPNGAKVTPPLFAHVYRVQTKLVEKGGNKWFVPQITFWADNAAAARLSPDNPIFQRAAEFYETCKEGGVQVNIESASKASTGGREPGEDIAEDIKDVF